MSKIEKFFGEQKISVSDKNEKTKLYELYKNIKEDLKHFSKQNRNFKIGKLSLEEIQILGVALKEFMPKFNGSVIIKSTNSENCRNYVHVNSETVDVLENILDDDYQSIKDSTEGFGRALKKNDLIEILFDRSPVAYQPTKRRSGEFFPYYNRSDIDLSVYDIYRESVKNTCCLISAFENSGVLTDNEINLLKNSIHTRCVNSEELKNICELLGVYCKLFVAKIDKEFSKTNSAKKPDADWLSKLGCSTNITYYGPGCRIKLMRDFNEKIVGERCVNIILFMWFDKNIYHFMVDTDNLISGDPKRIPETSVVKMIPKLMLDGKFEPIPEDVCKGLLWTFQNVVGEYNSSRDIRI